MEYVKYDGKQHDFEVPDYSGLASARLLNTCLILDKAVIWVSQVGQ